MTWNPSVRQNPIIATARPAPDLENMRLKEMESAAASVVAMILAKRALLKPTVIGGRVTGQASAWVVQGRINTTHRWFV